MPMSVLGPLCPACRTAVTTTDQKIWDKLSKRWRKNPGSISLDSLPVELIHSICSSLEPKDVQNFRLACRVFGAVGAEYLLDEMHTICKRTAFDRMVAISENSYISKSVRSLYYEADLLEPREDFWDWDAKRSHVIHTGGHPPTVLDERGDLTERSKRALERFWRKSTDEARRREWKITRDQKRTAFFKYQDYYEDQCKMFEEGFVTDCFEKCFRNCTKMDTVYVSLANEIRRKTRTDRREFKDAMASTFGDCIQESGIKQLTSILRAARRVGRHLKELYAGEISFRFFTQPEEVMTEIKEALKSLTTLEFHVLTPYSDYDHSYYDDPVDFYELEDALQNLETGCLREVLACIPEVRTLHLTLPDPFGITTRVALSSLFSSNQKFKHLESLRLFSIETTQEELVQFLLRHKDTLRSVFFSHLELIQGGCWDDFFRRISKQLPHLQRFRLSGEFWSPRDEYWFGEVDMARSTREAWAMDRYIRKGGPLPIDKDTVAFHIPHPMNHGKPGIGPHRLIDDPEFDSEEDESEEFTEGERDIVADTSGGFDQ